MEDLYNRKMVESFVWGREGKMNPIYEETWRQLRDQMDDKRLARSKKITGVRYIRVLDKKGWIKFETDSQTIRGKKYQQYIKLLDAKDLDALRDMTEKEAVRALMHGDIAVHCSCLDFRYKGFLYMGYQMGYGIQKETRFPKIRNPNLEGTVCKHLGQVLKAFMMYWTTIHRDMVKTRFFRTRWEED